MKLTSGVVLIIRDKCGVVERAVGSDLPSCCSRLMAPHQPRDVEFLFRVQLIFDTMHRHLNWPNAKCRVSASR